MRTGLVSQSQTHALRRRVLRPGLPPDGPDDVYPRGALFVAALDPDVIGCCIVFPAACPWRDGAAWQLRGMAVEPDRQGSGIGAAVLAEVFVHTGSDLLWCHARHSAVGFYERAGFRGHGPLFLHEETGIAHQAMARPAPPTQPAA